MGANTKDDDDLPAGLRSATQVNYSSEKKHNDVPRTAKAEPARAEPVKTARSQASVPSEVQALRDQDAVLILNEELRKAEERLAKGDKRAEADIAGLKREITRATGQSPMANQNPSLTVEEDEDAAPSMKESTEVNYNVTPTAAANKTVVPDRVKAEMGVGAALGAYLGNKQRKAANRQAESVQAQYANLPPEMRPVSPASLQRYINSQFSVQIPLEKLNELTGMDIRTMKEVQDARRLVEGSPASREPVVKDVNGRRTTVSYRNTPAVTPIDISMYAAQEPSLMTRAGNVIAGGAKSAASTLGNWLRPIAGGAVAAPQLMEAGTDYMQNRPVDPTQVASGLGGLAMMSRSTPIGAAGALAQIPYAVKHREELARAMMMHDVNPTAFPLGTPGADEPFIPR